MMDDLISRQAALDAVDIGNLHRGIVDALQNIISEIPSAQPERKEGLWIWDDEGFHCSECFYHASGNADEILSGEYRYCPNCGVKMRGEQE